MVRYSSLSAGVTLAAIAVAGTTAGLSPAYAAECKSVRGHLEETLVPPPVCTSPVGLCTIAQMFGHLKGEAHFTAAEIIPSADTPTTGVVFVIGDIALLDAKLGPNRGTLDIKAAAAFRTIGEGDLSDTQVIIGGSGDFLGATGSLRISGTFVGDTGAAGYEGTVCLP